MLQEPEITEPKPRGAEEPKERTGRGGVLLQAAPEAPRPTYVRDYPVLGYE